MFSLKFRISVLIELRSSKRTFSWLEQFWQCIKEIGVFCFKGTRVQWVQCILKIMFKFRHVTVIRHVNNFKPETSLVPKLLLFAVGQIKSKSTLQYTEHERAWQIEVSSLFHSLIVWGKKRITKSFCFAENLSNFGILMCIIIPVWWGK